MRSSRMAETEAPMDVDNNVDTNEGQAPQHNAPQSSKGNPSKHAEEDQKEAGTAEKKPLLEVTVVTGKRDRKQVEFFKPEAKKATDAKQQLKEVRS